MALIAMTLARPGVAILLALSALMSGCSSQDGRSSSSSSTSSRPGASDLPPVVLPDLSALSSSVRQQVNDQYQAFLRTAANPALSPAERAESYGELGELLLAAKFSVEAEACYLHAQALAPADLRWPYRLGHAYLLKADRSKAVAAFARALELNPSDLATLVWLGETHLDDGHPERAEPMFLKAVSVAPGSAAALFGAGRAALSGQQYREAAQYLERALSIDERASAIHYPLAMAYRGLGDRDKAEAHLRRRGSAFPLLPDALRPQVVDVLNSPLVYEAEGIRALRDGDWAAAAAAFRQGLELEPDDAALRHRLGSALYAAGDVVGATKEFEDVVRRSPAFVKAHISLGVILNLNERYQEAATRFTAAVAADPTFPEGHLGLAEALRMTGALESSLPHYERAIELDPSLVEPWIGGARALIGLERQKAAIVWLTDARRVHPGRPELDELWARVQPRAKD